ncbi:ComEC/Rec2 family competence protein [Nocardioides caeni]
MTASPLHGWAEQGATVDIVATVVSDPRAVEGMWADQVVVRLRVREAAARGERHRVGGTVVLIGEPDWAEVTLGELVVAEGRLAEPEDGHVAALLRGTGPPVHLRDPDPWWRASAALRESIRASTAHLAPAPAGLVPALVDGDDAGLPAEVEADFRTTGLTHLTAVSGTNLTLVVGALLLLARSLGVRRRWLTLVGALGIVGFILLARTEPSVLRAAAMGTVGLFAFGTDGRRRGLRALGVAVVGLVLIDPWLAVSAGFVLSVLATSGIVLVGPPLASGLRRWLPRGLAEAIAVPTAAQLACTPVVAVLSSEVSLIAIVANMLAGPLVGPATVLGLLGGLVGLLDEGLGRLVGTVAGWCVGWIIAVAQTGAGLPLAAIPWGSGPVAITLLIVICVALVPVLHLVVRRPRWAVPVAVLALLVVLGVPGRIWPESWTDWPPAGWLVVACDVGQGDALVLATGLAHTAVVVDVGPDRDAVDDCLDRLGVEQIALLVLTHFHADHVAGLDGVLRGRQVAGIESTAVLDPPEAAADVQEVAAARGVPVAIAPSGSTRQVGALSLQVLHPRSVEPTTGSGTGESANDASVVLLAQIAGVRLLLTGDLEPPGQGQLARMLPNLEVDVLKVPHHGSDHQDLAWLTSLGAEVALVTVGADNDYGHPSGRVLDGLEAAGAEVGRTDLGGDLAVTMTEGALDLVTRH